MSRFAWPRSRVAALLWLLAVSPAAAPAGPPGTTDAEEDLAPRGPLPPDGYMTRALELIKNGHYPDARGMLEPVVAGHPGWARAHFYLALTYHKEHRYEAARPLYERVIALDPADASPRLYYGWCLYYLGEVERSRAMFEGFLAAHGDYADAIFALGLLDFDADAIASAKDRFERATALAAAAGDAGIEAKSRARLADVHLRRDELTLAKQQLERSIALNPDNHETYFKLSRVLERLGDAAGAADARKQHARTLAARHGSASPGAEAP